MTGKQEAVTFLSCLPAHPAILKPVITLTGEGNDEVYLEWRGGSIGALLMFPGDSTYGYALIEDGRYIAGNTNVKDCHEIPADLWEYLTTNFKEE
jgi:hypothetical protein